VPDLICLGEILVDFCATRPDVTVGDAPGFTKAAGGAPANVAVAARRLGAEVGFVGAVGNDPFGAYLAGVLAGEGVDTSGLVRRDDPCTPLAFVAVRSDGAGDFFFYHTGGLCPLLAEHVRAEHLAAARGLHFGSISRIDESSRAATDKARRLAGENGLLVSYDPNYRPRLWPDAEQARRRIREGFAGTTVAKLSQQEWQFILETEDFTSGAGQLLQTGVSLVIRSEGPNGASFATASACGHVEGFKVSSVEFTGAGDAFVGSILVALLKYRAAGTAPGDLDEPALRQVIRRANAAGALTTTRYGAIPALPRREELEAFLSQPEPLLSGPRAGPVGTSAAGARRPRRRKPQPAGRKRRQ
jgi:sugar/nucleoside kinase (ribokinase family)